MWGKIPSFEASRPIYYPSTSSNYKGSTFSIRSKNDTDFKQQLNDIRRMGINLAGLNRRIGNKIFFSSQTERRTRFYDDLESMERLYEPTRLPNCSVHSHSHSVSSSSSYSARTSLFELAQYSYGDSSFISEPSYNWSSDFLRQSFTSYTSDPSSSQISEENLSDFLDDESSFDLSGSSQINDTLALTDMINNIFGYDSIFQSPTRHSESTSAPMTSESRAFENTILNGVPFNVKAPSSTTTDFRNSSLKIAEDTEYLRKPLEPVKIDKATIQNRRESIDSGDILGCTYSESKQSNGRNVVETILDAVITDVENSREQLKWN